MYRAKPTNFSVYLAVLLNLHALHTGTLHFTNEQMAIDNDFCLEMRFGDDEYRVVVNSESVVSKGRYVPMILSVLLYSLLILYNASGF